VVLAVQSAPVDGADWRLQAVEHRSELPASEVVGMLGELAYLGVQNFGNFEDATRWAESSNALAEELHIEYSPWAWVSLASVATMTGRHADAVTLGERAIQVADAADDLMNQVITRLMTSSALAALDRPEASATAVSEALQRAEASGNPMNIGAAVITAASNLLNESAGPNFLRSKEIIEAGSNAFAALGTNEMWLCTMFGWTLLGLGESEALAYLTRALRTADRLNAQHVVEMTLRLVAVAFVEAGYAPEAGILNGYVEAHLRPFRIDTPGQAWVQERLDRAGLTSTTSEKVPQNRGEIMKLVASIERSIAQDSPALLD